MFEQRYGGTQVAAPSAEPAPTKINNPDSLLDPKDKGLKINIGCGHVALPGYVNVDMRDLPGVDVVAGVSELPVKPGAAVEIFSAHVLEHFAQEELTRKLLPYWFNVLRSGGRFRAIVPDADAMIKHYASGDYVFDEFREVFFGGQEYTGDFHFNMYTPESLKKLLIDAGFVEVKIIEQGRRNGKCFEFEIEATRR